jgi:hypothetical protein
MPGLEPGIQTPGVVYGRVKPGHDVKRFYELLSARVVISSGKGHG